VSSSLAGAVNTGLTALQEAAARARGASTGRQDRIWLHTLRTAVLALHACLANLPDNLRRVLELTTGIDVPSALSPAAVAASLRVPVRQLAHLEMLGLRGLVRAARAHACAAATQTPSVLVPFSSFGTLSSEEGGPRGGVLAAREGNLPAAAQSATRSPGGGASLGISTPVAAGGVLLLIILGVVGILGLGLLDGIAPWDFHRNRRGVSRWIHRHPWSWHG
jgi:hypothetical protein